MSDLQSVQADANRCIEAGKTQQAVQLLLQLVEGYAKKKDFTNAEACREKILEIDDMALTEIVRAAELIDREKRAAIDPNHMALWKTLYAGLTEQETNELFFALQRIEVAPNQTLIQQGRSNSSLFLVEGGELRLTYRSGKQDRLLCKLAMGDIAGQESFFAASVSTATMTALSPSTLRQLDKSRLEQWKQNELNLAGRLESFCRKKQESFEAMQSRGIDRRQHERVRVSGPLFFQLVDRSGGAIGRPYKGDLIDISEGGISFEIKMANARNAAILLGRRAKLQYEIQRNGAPRKFTRSGIFIAVIGLAFGGFSAHMRFDATSS